MPGWGGVGWGGVGWGGVGWGGVGWGGVGWGGVGWGGVVVGVGWVWGWGGWVGGVGGVGGVVGWWGGGVEWSGRGGVEWSGVGGVGWSGSGWVGFVSAARGMLSSGFGIFSLAGGGESSCLLTSFAGPRNQVRELTNTHSHTWTQILHHRRSPGMIRFPYKHPQALWFFTGETHKQAHTRFAAALFQLGGPVLWHGPKPISSDPWTKRRNTLGKKPVYGWNHLVVLGKNLMVSSPFSSFAFLGSPLFSTHQATRISFFCWGPQFQP